MCGIAGATRNLLGSEPAETLRRMNDAMMHRGPDMGEVTFDSTMGLCHRRLSIIDLSEDGRQPMTTADERYTIVFNGEIYNFLELREELRSKGYNFRSRTDTEVLLYLYAEHGPESLQKIRGMFAYAIWDNLEKKLFAACDRIGKKPFYYHFNQDRFCFASELKSILEIEEVPRKIDYTAVADYFRYLYVPHPKTIFRDICKLSPGHFLIYSKGHLQVHQYWDIDFSDPLSSSPEELSEELLCTIRDAVKCRLISDVPLGAFLSGGVDSSGIVALMASIKSGPVTTCTIGFDDTRHDEAVYARGFASKLNAIHHEHYIRDEPAAIVKTLVRHFDEPFADSSMVPTYYVAKMARQHVTVALSGDGGDESFAGYEKYTIDSYENRVRENVPAALLKGICAMAANFPYVTILKRLFSLCSSALLDPARAFYVTNTFMTDRQAELLLSHEFKNNVGEYDPAHHTTRYYRQANGQDHLSRILYTDLKLFLPGDILVKVDRMTMANSLEMRSPLLDHKVIEFAARLPSALKFRNGEKKIILKEAFRGLVGEEVINRKKHGFTVPLDVWFRRELREMAENSIFNSDALESFFSLEALRDVWAEHQAGKMNHGTILWTIFIFALWLDDMSHKGLC